MRRYLPDSDANLLQAVINKKHLSWGSHTQDGNFMSVSVCDSTKVNCLKMPILIVFCFFVVVLCTILRMSTFMLII